VHGIERLYSGEELIAMGSGESLDPELVEDCIEHAASPTVAVGDEDPVVAFSRPEPGTDRRSDLLRTVVKDGREALHPYVLEAVAGDDVE
jgi:hypothetical protein